ncbi:MAG: hypothetical protein WAU50_22865 [Candidatus Sulfotelmatobacter sp.]
MQIEDFVRVYQAKSDEELIQLAAAPEQLTSEARVTLRGELSRRRISVAEDSGEPQNNLGAQVSSKAATGGLREPDWQGVGDFVTAVLRTYHSHFWLYFQITAPAVIISTVAIVTARNEVRDISRHLPRGVELLAHRTEILEIGLINYSAWFVSWLAFSFVFGAICIALEERVAGFIPSAWNSFVHIRERLSPFLRVSLLLLVLVVVTEGILIVLGTGVFWIFHRLQVHRSGLLVWAVSYVLTGLALLVASRFFLAVPAVILDDFSVGRAMLRSDELTQRKWLVLAALLAKSLIGGYVAGMCPFWLASFVRVSVPLPSWFPWILTIASVIGVTVVEPTMFVGFALLYLKASATDSAPSRVLASQLT